MPEQARQQGRRHEEETPEIDIDEVAAAKAAGETAVAGAKDGAEEDTDTKDILDEIDEILESDAAQFALDYVQTGGQ